jgi:hypothetical protein
MIMPTTGKRKTTRAQMTLPETGRLDLKISTVALVSRSPFEAIQEHLLHAMMSRTRTINPTMPPPVPACHGLALWTVTGAASTRRNMES